MDITRLLDRVEELVDCARKDLDAKAPDAADEHLRDLYDLLNEEFAHT